MSDVVFTSQFSAVNSALFIKVRLWLDVKLLSINVIESQLVMLVEPDPENCEFSKTIVPLLDRIVDDSSPELYTVQSVRLTPPVNSQLIVP